MADYNSSLPIRTQNNGDVVVNISDSTTESIKNTIKASSTSAVATDTALVVALSPNTSLPAGTNVLGAVTQSGGPWSTNITQIGGSALALGQTTMSASIPVTIASDQSAIPVSISGTVAVTQSTSPWIVKDLSDGSVAGGTAGTFSSLAGGQYNTTLPTLTNGQQAALQVDSSGRLLVDISTASAITVNQGTSPWVTSDLADGAIANGTAGTKSMLGGGIYLSAAPTLTSGNQNALMLDVNGNLKVDLATALPAGSNVIGAVTQSGGPWTSNITQIGGSALALGQTTMSASIPVTIASNQSALSVTVSGTVAVTQSTSPWVTSDLADGSSTGGTAGTKSLLAGGIYNTTLPTLTNGQQVGLQVDSSGRLLVDISTASAITVNQGTSPWVTSDLADGSVTGGTAGTKSMLAGGQYNATLPTLTTGQQAALQTDSSGRLLVGSIASALPSGTNIIGKVEITDGTNTVGVAPASTAATATQPAEVVALSPNSPLPAGTNAIGSVLANLQVSNAAVTTSNPVPVIITDSVPGTPIQNYQTSVALAAGSSVTLTYTVAASHTFTLQRIWASASGKVKVLAQNNGTTFMVGFNSTANPNIDFTLMTPPTIAAGNTVTVTFTNNDLLAFDVYVTIEGNQN